VLLVVKTPKEVRAVKTKIMASIKPLACYCRSTVLIAPPVPYLSLVALVKKVLLQEDLTRIRKSPMLLSVTQINSTILTYRTDRTANHMQVRASHHSVAE
jgi:hypothetical protein